MELILSLIAIAALAAAGKKEITDLREQVFDLLHNHKDAIVKLQNAQLYVPATQLFLSQVPTQTITSMLEQVESTELPDYGHTIIVGKSGSGKSNIVMLEIIKRIKAKHEIYIVDTKQELGPIFGKHCKKVVGTDSATEIMNELLKIAKERRDKFMQASAIFTKPCRDRKEYEKLTGERMPTITLVLEELIVLMGRIEQDQLIELLVVGRSAGVFIFALSQYLKADILDRKGSINFMSRVFLGRWDMISIKILFGPIPKNDAHIFQEFLGPPGKGLVELEGQRIDTVTFPRIDDKQLEEWMQ
jgi:hypothetical protein